ncbi:uncharacterized protein LOC120357994 [Solenopsis invicta]|uniref:uncharacterized protein LOC120357994 n=1 Tax=Solenopsis invicta TaxID=13686 RepID=UPI00193DD21A|nr:uncharacterized protein LOC120357994 [Solenopsis invicta]XP_039306188.1 uncharacterized protein LOC120357994 [Solenopsis invicta]
MSAVAVAAAAAGSAAPNVTTCRYHHAPPVGMTDPACGRRSAFTAFTKIGQPYTLGDNLACSLCRPSPSPLSCGCSFFSSRTCYMLTTARPFKDSCHAPNTAAAMNLAIESVDTYCVYATTTQESSPGKAAM